MADKPGFVDRTFDEIVEVIIYGASHYLSVSVFVPTCGFRKKPRSPRELIHILTYRLFRKANRLTSEASARMLATGGGP